MLAKAVPAMVRCIHDSPEYARYARNKALRRSTSGGKIVQGAVAAEPLAARGNREILMSGTCRLVGFGILLAAPVLLAQTALAQTAAPELPPPRPPKPTQR